MITGTYNLQVNPQWRQIALENVYLECDTTLAPVVINLFEIIDLERFWNVKIYISDTNSNASTNSITINSAAGEFINLEGQTSFVINQDGGNCVLQVSNESIWSVSSQNNLNINSYSLSEQEIGTFEISAGNITQLYKRTVLIPEWTSGDSSSYNTGIENVTRIISAEMTSLNTIYSIGSFTNDGNTVFTACFEVSISLTGDVIFTYNNAPNDGNNMYLTIKYTK